MARVCALCVESKRVARLESHLLFRSLLSQVFERHERVAQRHARGGVGHHLTNALAGLSPLAMDIAVLAVTLMVVWARLRAGERGINCFTACWAQARGVLVADVMGGAVDAPDCLERLAVLIYSLVFHIAISIKESCVVVRRSR